MARLSHIDEPDLVFGNGSEYPDPKLGIARYGPYSAYTSNKIDKISIGIVGDSNSVQKAKEWIEESKTQISTQTEDVLRNPSFTGVNSSSVWSCELEVVDDAVYRFKEGEINDVLETPQLHERIAEAANLFAEKIAIIGDRTSSPDIIICAIPSEIDKYCGKGTSRSQRPNYTEEELKLLEVEESNQSSMGQFIDDFKSQKEVAEKAIDLRRAIKAKSMSQGIPTQLIREATLDGDTYQNKAKFAWNFWSAQYFKAGGLPWKLSSSDTTTCFVGISFYKEKKVPDNKMRTALSQIFSPTGESFVLKGDTVIAKGGKSPKLTENSAKDLLKRSINAFEEQTGQEPRRVVVHKSSKFSDDEVEGFKTAIGDASYDLVSFGSRSKKIRLIRNGNYPVHRGTLMTLTDSRFLLYTNGYIPYLNTYPGTRIPSPKLITDHHGDSEPAKIAEEIMGLTKLSWNNADFSTGLPITLDMSESVGEVLSEAEPGQNLSKKLKYYI